MKYPYFFYGLFVFSVLATIGEIAVVYAIRHDLLPKTTGEVPAFGMLVGCLTGALGLIWALTFGVRCVNGQ